MKITRSEDYKEITKEITNIGQQLSYSEVTPDIRYDEKSASNISSFSTFSSWSLEQNILVHPSLGIGPAVGKLYTGKSFWIWESLYKFGNIL